MFGVHESMDNGHENQEISSQLLEQLGVNGQVMGY
jgi:hypothetical protein